MKSIKKAICLLLCAVMLATVAGCKKHESVQQGEVIPTTDTYVIKNGVSPYKILIPENASNQLQFAATDFQFFFQEATGVKLEITTKVDNVQGKYFSIGDTAIKAAAGVTTTMDEVNRSGYKVVTYGDAIIMAGNNDKSSTYAVYGYLGKQFGLEIYGEDIYEITQTTNAKLADLNWTDVPDVPFRCGGTSYAWYGTTEYMSRMRWDTMTEGWGLASHSYFVILPPEKYLADHPDWYNDPESPTELCQTNEEMKAQFIENMKQIIRDTPDSVYYMLGHEDGIPVCDCEDCTAFCAQYNDVYSSLMVVFTNDVVRKLNAWAAEEIPNRELKFCTFAYTSTEAPPVEYDQATQTYHPINNDSKLMLEDNLGIMIAPIGSHISVPYFNNPSSGPVFEGWDVLTDNLYVWAYSCPFANYLVPFDGFGAFKQNYQDYVNAGVEYVFEQGFLWNYAPNWHELRGYVCSKLMWDTSLDTDTLIRDFIRVYYGPGWESIYEFFILWRLRMTELQEGGMYSYTASQLVQDWLQPELYPKTLLDQYEKLFDEALIKTEELKETDPDKYEVYRDNIRAERCLIRYMSLSMYHQYYDSETYSAMIDEFMDISGRKKFTYASESNVTLEELVQPWLNNLNNK